jgi:hypothetical protein
VQLQPHIITVLVKRGVVTRGKHCTYA